MARSKDNLFVLIHGNLEEANLVTISIPADEVGPAYKKRGGPDRLNNSRQLLSEILGVMQPAFVGVVA